MSDSESDERGEQEIFFSIPALDELAESIDDEEAPIAKRMRSCFLLKQLHTPEAIEVLSRGLRSSSTLLGHECAYVLGQMQDRSALPYLSLALQDTRQHPIVRHECAEALANIDADESLPLLLRYCDDASPEVAETCCIAAEKMRQARRGREQQRQEVGEVLASKYASVDPAPPLPSRSVSALLAALSDGALSMYDRYRAMFALRNLGTEEAILALAASLSSSSSPVFRHEVAYVLGQMQHPAALPCLRALLADRSEHAMVRHEAAEAIGSIAEDDSEAVLGSYATDVSEDVIVKESVLVALDLAEYWSTTTTRHNNHVCATVCNLVCNILSPAVVWARGVSAGRIEQEQRRGEHSRGRRAGRAEQPAAADGGTARPCVSSAKQKKKFSLMTFWSRERDVLVQER